MGSRSVVLLLLLLLLGSTGFLAGLSTLRLLDGRGLVLSWGLRGVGVSWGSGRIM